MSPNNPVLIAGLTALGLIGFATRCDADPAPPASPAPSPAVLLLSNGSTQQGLVTVDGGNYVLHCRGGKIPVPRSKVIRVFDTLEDVYRYKRTQFPEVDPDEHMKLARWCLTSRLKAEAKEELRAVLALSPAHAQARAMLESIENEEERVALPPRDSALVRTSAEVAEGPSRRPDEVNPADLRRMRAAMNLPDTPQIFDLPPALAVKRANEFAHGVHPVLQAYCAKCHDTQYPGRFQLIPMKARRDRTPDVFRANLDATLALIDPRNPPKSEILSRSLVPHGTGPNARPIFRGANDPAYQILSSWVNSLHGSRPGDGVTSSALAPPAPAGGEGFATTRGGPAPLPLTPTPPSDARPAPLPPPNPAAPLPPVQLLPGSDSGKQPYPPPVAERPAPSMLGGPRPNLNPNPGAGRPQVSPPASVAATPASTPAGMPPLPPEAPAAAVPADADGDAPGKKRKPLQIDPALLERALMNRYTPQ
ncbi:MAG: hypothetical protein JO355_10450 [Planctomycetaceae bacterium]|nr:hypothetical protein [Planctomycetaceae bacterium]